MIYNHYKTHKPLLDEFTALLRARSDHVTEWVDPGCDRLFHAARDHEFDLIVCSIGGAIEYGANVLRLHGPVARNMMYGWMRLGVPAVFVRTGRRFVGRPEGYADEVATDYRMNRYHQPADELTGDELLGGLVQQTRVAFRLGWLLADSALRPAWNPSEAFAQTRAESERALGD